jgi:hypothetical protein
MPEDVRVLRLLIERQALRDELGRLETPGDG